MAKQKKTNRTGIKSERAIQEWLQASIATEQLRNLISGESDLDRALNGSMSAEWRPAFPIDYLTRLRVLQAAKSVLDELYELIPVSSSSKSISRTKNELLYPDLIYSQREGSRFIVFEIKKENATARETMTELLAYEHEILNHIPFASSHDILMVVVSPEFSPLLDHAIMGLVTWSRRRILCLKIENWGNNPILQIHLPSCWAALGQQTLPPSGIQTAYLCPYPNPELTPDQALATCETAAAILAREADRAGGSGFVMIVKDHFFPNRTQCPFLIIAGAVNPYCFLVDANDNGFLTSTSSSLITFLLSNDTRDLSSSWDWITTGGNAAVKYLESFGEPMWEGFSNWANFRDTRRWRIESSVTPDRHLCPISTDFWGIVGDFARDVVINGARMKNFLPSYLKPGLDWHCPHMGVMLLDEISVQPVVKWGEWTFEAIFMFGIILGRLGAISATYASSDDNSRLKLQASLFWAEADLMQLANEAELRYLASKEIKEPPPSIPIGSYDNCKQVMDRIGLFSQWVIEHFIGPNFPLLQKSFFIGTQIFPIYDPQFLHSISKQATLSTMNKAAKFARELLSLTVKTLPWPSDEQESSIYLRQLISKSFNGAISINDSLNASIESIKSLNQTIAIDKLFKEIPYIVSKWHPQLSHTLAHLATQNRDWKWYQQQIQQRRTRGVKYPCLLITPGGDVGVAQLPEDSVVPRVKDPSTQVLLVNNLGDTKIISVITWNDLMTGKLTLG